MNFCKKLLVLSLISSFLVPCTFANPPKKKLKPPKQKCSQQVSQAIDHSSEQKYSGGLEGNVPRQEGRELHHVISQKAWRESGLEIKNEDRPVILMSPKAHKQTPNFGSSKTAKEFRETEKQFLQKGDIEGLIHMELSLLPPDYRPDGPKGSPARHVLGVAPLLQAKYGKSKRNNHIIYFNP